MSDPSNQRADGCSVFFTFLVLALLLSVFYFAQIIFEPDVPAPVTHSIDSARREKVQLHRSENDAFLSNVDQFHADHNTTIETSMNEVLIKYRASSLRSQQNQSQ